MNRLMFLVAVLVLATLPACSQENSLGNQNEQCNKAGCVTLWLEYPVKALQPIPLRFIVKPSEAADQLRISLYSIGAEKLHVDRAPLEAEVIQAMNDYITWEIKAKPDTEYEFEGSVVFPAPSKNLKVSYYRVR